MKSTRLLALAVALPVLGGAVHAQLYHTINTGYDPDSGLALSVGDTDPRWEIVARGNLSPVLPDAVLNNGSTQQANNPIFNNPAGLLNSNEVVLDPVDPSISSVVWNPPSNHTHNWFDPSGLNPPARWVSEFSTGQNTSLEVLQLRFTFTLTAEQAANARLSGGWATQNAGVLTLWNNNTGGHEILSELPFLNSQQQLTAFYSANLAEGDNHLYATFANSSNLMGVIVAGDVSAVPEPATYGLFGAGLLIGLIIWRRRTMRIG
ncbi:MAG: PEP-CTERM sorting domain-containing protein [Puniceicoccaceae bacterium]|nr:MAG: PEP-CTERM sorting domain-containing protein [Puniceicoccaceae bacterium]